MWLLGVPMGAIEFRLVDPLADGAHVPVGWTAYRSTKTVFEMLREQVELLMTAEELSRHQAEETLLQRAMASIEGPPQVR